MTVGMTEGSDRISMATRLRNNFLTGLIICAPMAITIYLTWTFIRWADSWVKPYIPNIYNPDNYLPFAVPGFGLIVALLMITLVGFLAANFIGGMPVIGRGRSFMVTRTMPLVRRMSSTRSRLRIIE